MKKNVKQLKSTDVKTLRADILAQQGGRCLICGKVPKIACLDHEHSKKVGGSGLVRGVLCNSCNVFLAKSENNCKRYNVSLDELPSILRAMADYLEKPHYPYKHPSEAPKRKIVTKASYNEMLRWHKKNGSAKRVANYRYDKRDRPAQGLTKPLAKMFEMAGVEPKFYK